MAASSNWLALQKTMPKKSFPKADDVKEHATKRRKLDHSSTSLPKPSATSLPISKPQSTERHGIKNGESISALRSMIHGDIEWTEDQRLPGKYLAIDCEMVGIGIDGSESSLARVSLVNFHGAVQLDTFVRQRERVVDYRTQYSGVRESDMKKAIPFEKAQKQVAELVKDKILIGHAIHHDLKALLLSHPRPMIRDTQFYAAKHKVVKSKYIALRNLVKQELDVTIQSGEHSSVTDARATMAIYRLHRRVWEKASKPMSRKKRMLGRTEEEYAEDDPHQESPEAGTESGSGRKGVSSGLTTVIRRNTIMGQKKKWWKEVVGISKASNT